MTIGNTLRHLRGALGNAFVWGACWAGLALATFTGLQLAGRAGGTILDGLFIAARFGVVGVFAGAAFSSVVRLLYRGKRLSQLSWVRFGIGGGIVTSVFVPVFLQTMNLLSGDGLVPMMHVLDDSLWTSVFGGIAAAGSLKLAQHAERLVSGVQRLDLLTPAADDRLGQPLPRRARSTAG